MIVDGRVPCSLEQIIAGRSRLEDRGAIGLAKAIEEMKTLKVLRIPQSGITPKGTTRVGFATYCVRNGAISKSFGPKPYH